MARKSFDKPEETRSINKGKIQSPSHNTEGVPSPTDAGGAPEKGGTEDLKDQICSYLVYWHA